MAKSLSSPKLVRSSDYVINLIAFIIFPLFNLVYGLKIKEPRLKRFALLLFITFIGFSFVVVSDTIDANTSIDRFDKFGNRDFNYLYSFVKDFFLNRGIDVDVFEDLVYFFVSRFTSSTSVLFGFFAFLFGYFYLKVIVFINEKRMKGLFASFFLFFVVIVINPIMAVNQFRFWFAAMIFIWSALKYFETNDKRYLLLAWLGGLAHFGVYLCALVMSIYFILGKKVNLYIGVLVITIFVSELNLIFVKEFFNFLGPAFSDRASTYGGEIGQKLAISLEERVWYAAYWRKIMLYSMEFVLIVVILRKKDLMSKMQLSLYAFILLYFSCLNVLSGFAMVFRYEHIGFFMFGILAFNLARDSRFKNDIKKTFLVLLPSAILMFGIQIKQILSMLSPAVLLSNPIIEILFPTEFTFLDIFGID